MIQILQFDHYYHVKSLFFILFKQRFCFISTCYPISELQRPLNDILEYSIDRLLQP
jgi:hypothetical protein